MGRSHSRPKLISPGRTRRFQSGGTTCPAWSSDSQEHEADLDHEHDDGGASPLESQGVIEIPSRSQARKARIAGVGTRDLRRVSQ